MAIGTTNYPTSLDTVVELVEAANGAFDTLTEGINSSVTSLAVNDASKFANSGIVLIDSEYIAYGSKTSTALQSLTRGFEGSSAASHSSGATVRQVITAASNNVKSAAIIALETKLGTGTDIAWGQMAPLTASRLAVTDGSGDVAASGITHDATNLILGNVGAINFDDSPTPTAGDASLARLTWNDSEGTLNLTLKGSNVTVPLSQRDTVRVVNTTASTMAGSNYQVVRITTPAGQRVGVTLAQADTEANSTDIIGVISETIASNGTGFVTTRGIIAGINTTGSLQSETWNEGDVLYLSPTVAGGLTKVKPVAPDNLCIIGYVVYKHATEGKIFVAIQTSWEIEELHDVKITGTPAAGSLLIRNATGGIWENATLTAGSNISITNADKSITIATTGTGDVTGPASSTDTAIARFSGTTGKVIQNSLIGIDSTGALGLPDNVRQTFNPGSTTPGLNVGANSGDPSTPSNGDIWYNSATSGTGNRQFRVRRNGATETLAVVPPVSTADREIPTINPSTGNLDNVSEMFYISADNALKVGDIATGRIQLSAVTTETPSISAIGADSNINLNLVSKGTGTVQANGVAVATISDSQTLTNKTINGSNNTITNVSLSTGVTGTLPIANGGTGATTQQAAMNALAGSTLSGYYLRGNGSNVVMAQVQAGDITGTLAVANGGTGATTLAANNVLLGNGTSAVQTVAPGTNGNVLTSNGTTWVSQAAPSGGGGEPNTRADGRLTLVSGTAITTTDQTAKTTLYYTPYIGNKIALFDGSSSWTQTTFTERSITIPSTSNTNYDVFVYNNAGTVTLELTAWTNNTTRATPLTTQDGVLVRSGATTRRYVGTIRTTATSGQCEDSSKSRFVWNLYNQVSRGIECRTTSSYTYTINVWRAAENSTTLGVTRVDFVLGLPVFVVFSSLQNVYNASNAYMATGIGLDQTSGNDAFIFGGSTVNGVQPMINAEFRRYIDTGYHFLQRVEISSVVGTTSWYGTGGSPNMVQSGSSGFLFG